MNKALIFSDLHVHLYKQFNENGRRLKNGIAFLNYIFKLADANQIEYLLMPGDLFNNMQIISTKVVNAVTTCLSENFEQYPNIKIIAISGNHDEAEINLIDKPAESALDYLAEILPNFDLLEFTDTDDYITSGGTRIRGISYLEHKEHFREALTIVGSKVDPNRTNLILMMHQIVGSGLPIEDDIQPDDPLFDPFTLILNGHIHNGEQLTDKFINVGSPQARDAGDIGKNKGFWIVDLDDPVNTISFKDITDKYPQFIHVEQGKELTDWESEQYVIFQPKPTTDTVKEKELSDKFSTSLAPVTILENYCQEVLPSEEVKEKLEYGLKLLS
jgi:DNA repair exonuclease SbcCD nuclease subunit